MVALDAAGEPLMPCLLWMDMRSAEQTKQVLATRDEALRVNSDGKGPVSAEWMVPKALWIKQNLPHIFNQATHVCEYQVSTLGLRSRTERDAMSVGSTR